MKLSEIDPFIRYAYNQVLRPTPFATYSYDHRLLYVQDGSLIFHCQGLKKRVDETSLMLWQPGVPYRFETQATTRIIILNFDFTQNFSHLPESLHVVRDSEFRGDRVLERPVIDDCPALSELVVCPSMKFVETDLMYIVRELRDKRRFFRESASAVLKRVICDAARCTLTDPGTVDTVERVISFIRENYFRQITNKDIAESVSYHEYYVNKLIQKQTGFTLHQYLLNCRVQNAEKLLITTDHPVERIAEMCGFTSAAYFISAFRRQCGETPSEYRRRRSGMI